MIETQALHDFLQDCPDHWPHHAREGPLPEAVEVRLKAACECVLSDAARAAALGEQAVTLARQERDEGLLARCLCAAADLMRRIGHPDRAYALCLEAQTMLERLDDNWRATRLLLLRGCCWLSVGEHERALTLLSSAALRFEKVGEQAELACCRALVATAWSLADDAQLAVEYAAHATATLPVGCDPELERQVRTNEARLRLALGASQAARGDAIGAAVAGALAFAALPDIEGIDVAMWNAQTATILDAWAAVAWACGSTASYWRAVLKLVRWARRWKSPLERGLAWARLTHFHRTHDRPQRAMACARRAITAFSALAAEPHLHCMNLVLAELLEQAGRTREAYEAYAAAMGAEVRQQRETITMRARMLAMELEAELALRRTEQTLAYAQRMSNVGHLVASVNHELNQPLASIRMLAETSIELLDQGRPAEVRGTLKAMLRLAGRVNDVAAKLAAFPGRAEEPRAVRLAYIVDEALEMLRSRLAQTPCMIERRLLQFQVRADEGQLVRVIANLINNSLDAMTECESRRLSFVGSAADGVVTLRVADDGPGLTPQIRERLFQPFFSTKAAGQGLGLGLALSRDVMREMSGELRLAESVGGAAFELSLPQVMS